MPDSDHWSGLLNSITAVLMPPGARDCWNGMKNRINPEFRAFIDKLIDAPA